MPKATTIIAEMTREELIAEISLLKKSHTDYEEVFGSMLDVCTRVNNDGIIEMVSPSVMDMFGFKAEDLLGKPATDRYVNPDDRNNLLALIKKDGFCTNFQAQVYTSTGDIKVVSVNAKVYVDGKGNALGVESIVRDITEQKKDEELLAKHTALLDASQQLANLGHWYWDMLSNTAEWSPELRRIYGLDECDLVASFESHVKMYEKLVHIDDQEIIRVLMRDFISGEANQIHYEERIIRKSGEMRYLESWATLVRNEAGQPIEMFAACLDITDKKLIEQKLIESNKEFQNLFEFSPDARFIHKNDIIVNVNLSFLKLYGYSSKEEIIGKSLASEQIITEQNDRFENLDSLKLFSPHALDKVHRVNKDGSTAIIEFQSSAIQYNGSTHVQVISFDITERYEMEEEIRLNTLLLKESEKIAHLGHISWHIKGAVKWSDELYRICGINFDVTPSVKYAMKIVHPDDLSYVLENFNLAIEQVKDYNIDHRIKCAETGEVKWVHAEMQLKFDSTGNLINLLGTLLDITTKKQDQTALLKSEEEFRSIYESTYSGIPLISLSGKFLKANQRFIDLLGYTELELLSMSIDDITHPDDRIETREKLAALISGQISRFEVEKRYLKKSGSELICNMVVTAPIGIAGVPEFLTGSFTDITEEKKIQEIFMGISEIQSTFIGEATSKKIFEKMLRTLLKITRSTLGCIAEINEQDGKQVYISHSRIALSSTTVKEILFPDAYQIAFAELTRQVLKTGEPVLYWNTDEVNSSGTGGGEIENFMGLPFYSNSQLIGMICVANKKNGYYDDNVRLLQPFLATCSTLIAAHKNEINRIAEQQASERMKEVFTQELELKVAERTEDLERTQKELFVSLEKEKILGALKSRFVSTASHQFRTPLTVIQANMGLLEMQKDLMFDDLKPTFEKTNKRIIGQIGRMTTMINDVLILSKIDSGSIVPEIEPVDLTELCTEIIDNYNEIQEDERKMTLSVSGEESMIAVDARLVSHAISNFVCNSFKYSINKPAPEIKIEFEAETTKLSIIDYGLGIPEEELMNLFEPFYRASNVAEVSGTGLGISIAKEYIELNNGKIEVKSAIQKGTEFILTFKN